MTLYVHDGLKREAFLWEIKKLFPSEKDFLDYAAGRGPGLPPAQAAKQAEVRYVLEGRITDAAQRTVSVRLFDAQTGSTAESVLPLDADTGLKGLREGLLDVLAANGLPLSAQQRSKALWEEKTSLPALKALGAATREHYTVLTFKPKGAKPSLNPYQQAIQLAPESYLARNWLGWGLWRTEDLPGIKREFEAAVTLNPSGVDALDGLISIAKKQNDIPGLKQWSAHVAQALGKNPDEAVATGLLKYAESLHAQGKNKQALQPAREALALREKVLGPEHPDVASILDVLADVAQADGDYATAKPLYERALAIQEKVLGPEDDSTLITMVSLAEVLKKSGDLPGVKTLYEHVLATVEKRYGPEHAEVAMVLNALAETLDALGDHAQAKTMYERALAIYEKTEKQNKEYLADALYTLSQAIASSEDRPWVREMYSRITTICEHTYGPDSKQLADSLDDIIKEDISAGNFNDAIKNLSRCIAIREKILSHNHQDTTKCLGTLCLVAKAAGNIDLSREACDRYQRITGEMPSVKEEFDKNFKTMMARLKSGVPQEAFHYAKLALVDSEMEYGRESVESGVVMALMVGVFHEQIAQEQSKELTERAKAILTKPTSEKHPQFLAGVDFLASALERDHRFDDALRLRRKAVEVSQSINGAEDTQTATACGQLAYVLDELGSHAEARNFAQQAVNIHVKNIGPENKSTIDSMTLLGRIMQRMEDYEAAKGVFEQVVNLSKKVFGPGDLRTATGYNNLAFVSTQLGDYSTAKELYDSALQIREKELGSNSPAVATVLSNIAALYYNISEVDNSIKYLKRALSILEADPHRDEAAIAQAAHNLAAALLEASEDIDQAFQLENTALGIIKKLYGDNHPYTIPILLNISKIHFNKNQLKESLRRIEDALLVCAATNNTMSSESATLLASKGVVEETQGHKEEARKNYEQALFISLSIGNPELTGKMYTALATYHNNTGKYYFATLFGKRAFNLVQRNRASVSKLGLKTFEAYSYSKESASKGLMDSLLLQNRVDEALQVHRAFKNKEFYNFMQLTSHTNYDQALQAQYTREESRWVKRIDEFASRLKPIVNLYIQIEKSNSNNSSKGQEVHKLKKQINDFRQEFSGILDEMGSSLSSTNTNSGEIHETASLKKDLKDFGPDTAFVQFLMSEQHFWIIAITKDKTICTTPKEKCNRDLIEFFSLPLIYSLHSPQTNPHAPARSLYKLLIEPIAKELDSMHIQNLMLSLDDILRYVPFAALHDGERYLIQRYGLALLTYSARASYKDAPIQNWKVTGLGTTKALQGFSPLPGVREEMDSIARVLPATIHLDNEFTKDSLRNALNSGGPVIHIASHFKLNQGHAKDSFLLLGDGSRLTLEELDKDYQFTGMDMLTLSACETAVDSIDKGDGSEVESLGALAIHKGAKAVLATLWPVADESTAIIMGRFYELRQKQGLSRAQALRKAQMSLLEGTARPNPNGPARGQAIHTSSASMKKQKKWLDIKPGEYPGYTHPYYWAPFVLMGNWR
ncbi:hypothetical protein JCM15519_25090 [Fundidesulfovibrio butyratiphilus]